MLPQQEPPAMSFAQMQQTAMNVVENLCSIVCMPVEIVLRPLYGTRYFPVPIAFFSAMMMIFLPFLSATATAVTNMIPFHTSRPPAGLFGIGSFAMLYFFLSFLQGFRLWRRMVHMEMEQNSTFEGPPLPFFRLIPGNRFWLTRIVLEPLFILVSAWILEHLFLIQSGLGTYLDFAAFTLAMKNFCVWYHQWEYIRNLMDMRFAAPIIAKLSRNEATEDELAPIHLASFPKNIAQDIRQEAVSHIARLFSSKDPNNLK
jgi:hypothetical protein